VELTGELLVVISLRGGCDALNLLAPLRGSDRQIYEQERPNLAMPLEGPQALLPLGGPSEAQFGLHPSAGPLLELWKAKRLALIPAAGLVCDNRSHFDAQAMMDAGLVSKRSIGTGWLTRHLAIAKNVQPSLSVVSLGSLTAAALLGCESAVQVTEPKRVALTGQRKIAAAQLQALEKIYAKKNDIAGLVGRNVLGMLQTFDPDKIKDYLPPQGVEYPHNDLGNRLKTLAQLLKMGLPLRVATLEMGGWDTHKYQGVGTEGGFARQVDQLSQAVQAFDLDLRAVDGLNQAPRTTIVVMTEFGRRLKENANRGSDHGHGGLMMVLGSKVKGGKLYGAWPGLQSENLYDRADLAVRTDYRQVLYEVLKPVHGWQQAAALFPDFHPAGSLGFAD